MYGYSVPRSCLSCGEGVPCSCLRLPVLVCSCRRGQSCLLRAARIVSSGSGPSSSSLLYSALRLLLALLLVLAPS